MLYRQVDTPTSGSSSDKDSNTALLGNMLSRTSGVLENIIADHKELESTQLQEETFRLNSTGDNRVIGRKSPENLESSPQMGHLSPQQDSDSEFAKRPSCGSDVCARRTSSGGFYSSQHIVPIVRGKIYFTVLKDAKEVALRTKEHPLFRFVSSEHHESYLPYNTELGPVDLGVIVSFCKELHTQEEQSKDIRPLVYYTLDTPGHATNGALLLGCYLMLQHNMPAAMVSAVFDIIQPSPFEPFLDASGMTEFSLSLADCFAALERSVQKKMFSLQSFDLGEFNRLALPCHGDVSRIGNKFVAFKGPHADEEQQIKREAHSPEMYADMFAKMGVTAVVRLNEKHYYDPGVFTERGIRHYEVPFRDCTFPSRKLAKLFMDTCDEEGLVAVHCKAGLGRTGTVIALWMMKNQGFTAKSAIAWLRMSRPGSVIGPQQSYLEKCELREWIGNWMGKTPAEAGGKSEHRVEKVAETQGTLAEQFDRECMKRALARGGSQGCLMDGVGDEAPPMMFRDGSDHSGSFCGGLSEMASSYEDCTVDDRASSYEERTSSYEECTLNGITPS